MILLKKKTHRLLLLPKLKSDSGAGPFFPKILTPGPDPGPKKNAESRRRGLRLPGSDPTYDMQSSTNTRTEHVC